MLGGSQRNRLIGRRLATAAGRPEHRRFRSRVSLRKMPTPTKSVSVNNLNWQPRIDVARQRLKDATGAGEIKPPLVASTR